MPKIKYDELIAYRDSVESNGRILIKNTFGHIQLIVLSSREFDKLVEERITGLINELEAEKNKSWIKKLFS